MASPELQYAAVHKARKKGRVAQVDFRVVFGTVLGVLTVLAQSVVSKAMNTAFVARHNGTDRDRNARKVRKSYSFPSNWEIYEVLTYFTPYSYTSCWGVQRSEVITSCGF